MAERERFELSVRLHAHQFSRLAHSTTLPPLRRVLLPPTIPTFKVLRSPYKYAPRSVFPDLRDLINLQLFRVDFTKPSIREIGQWIISVFVFAQDDLFNLFWRSRFDNHIVSDHLCSSIVVDEGDMVFHPVFGLPVIHHQMSL